MTRLSAQWVVDSVGTLTARNLLPLAALGLLALGASGCVNPAAPVAGDALQGMEPNGRIPKVALPADVPNPERWRYLPEARIVEGNVFERFLVSTFAVPIFFFKSDVGAGGGISLTDIDFRGQRRREFATTTLTYTTEGQQNYGFLWRRWLDHRDLPGGGVIQEERSLASLSALVCHCASRSAKDERPVGSSGSRSSGQAPAIIW